MNSSHDSFATLELRLHRAASDLDGALAHIDVTQRVLVAVATPPTPPRRWPLLAAASAVLLGTATLSIPSARAGVARWLGVADGVVDVRLEPFPGEVPAQPGTSWFGDPVTVAEAEALTGLTVPAPGLLGPPDAVYVDAAQQRIIAVYAPSVALPDGAVEGVGAIVEVIRGRLEPGLYVKYLEGAEPERTRVGDAEAIFIGGPAHPLAYVDDSGEVIVETARLAGPTLLWDDDGVTYRLESNLGLAAAVALAETIP